MNGIDETANGAVTGNSMKTHAQFRLAVYFVAIVILGTGAWYFLWDGTPDYSDEVTAFAVLQERNAVFAEAGVLFSNGRFAEANTKYRETLSAAQDLIQEAQIKYLIALTDEKSGNYAEAIRQLKEIAANDAYIPLARATAVQRIGFMYGDYDKEANAVMKAETFKGAPYQSFLVPTSTALSYANLFEYAVSLYPVAIAELFIADGHLKLYAKEKNKDSSVSSGHLTAIEVALAAAALDMERLSRDPNSRSDLARAYLLQGKVLASLALMGKKSYESAELAYENAIDMYAQIGSEGFARYFYAVFLSEAPMDRSVDIRRILAPLSSSKSQDPVMSFFASERNTKNAAHDNIVKLAVLDPEFKALLQSLGWKDADFK